MNPLLDRKDRSPMDLLGKHRPDMAPQPFVGSKEFRKIVILTIFALALTAAVMGKLLGPDATPRPETLERDPRLPAQAQILEPDKVDLLPFEGMADVAPISPEVKKDLPYLSALGALSRIPHEEIAKRADPQLTSAMLTRFPDRCRGAFVRVRGLLLEMWSYPEKLPTNPAGVQDVYIAFLIDWNTDDVVAVHFLEKPDFTPSIKEDLIRVEGVFYQVLTYKAVTSHERQAPVVLARRLTKLPPMKIEQRTGFAWTVALIAAGILALILAAGYYNRKKEQEFEQRMKGVKIKKTRDGAATPAADKAPAAPVESPAAGAAPDPTPASPPSGGPPPGQTPPGPAAPPAGDAAASSSPPSPGA